MSNAPGAPRRTRATSRAGMVVTTIALPEALHDTLRHRALDERKAMTVLVREILEAWSRQAPRTHARRGGAR